MMRGRTKRKLKFYLSLLGLAVLTIVTGVFFVYLAYISWQMGHGLGEIKYELFVTMGAILFVMCITDIFLFFHLIIKRKY
ncbi:MAG: hypothetical protein JSW53_00375 [Candidatus Bathyarchaeota archaeon]|nr:MAG: hypothetical protein JSW53_00375 [Candidatus Bathyarchaeota archaeon]